MRPPMKLQSAMEYLMTYGWAILIIAIVLAALFQLGVFDSSTFTPKAPPGSCQVFRPNGPYTTQFISTEGVCNGELPQYVARIGGQTQVITVQGITKTTPNTTVTVWFNAYSIATSGDSWNRMLGYGASSDCTGHHMFLIMQQTSIYFWGGCDDVGESYSFSFDKWYFGAFTYSASPAGNFIALYIDGQIVGSPTSITAINLSTINQFDIGYNFNGNGYGFNGTMANVQVYGTSLSSNEIEALYLEGIGGAPISLQNLVAWYPLNGNAQDYSGNNNNGKSTNVTFTSSWEGGYAPP